MAFDKIIKKFETNVDTIERTIDEISLMCIDIRNKIDKIKELNNDEDIEQFPELDHFENLDDEDIDEEEDK